MDWEKAKQELKARPHIIEIGYGYKVTGGKITDIPCIITYVKKKLPISALAANEVIPIQVEGLLTDVQEIKTVDALSYTERKRPVPGGYSVGHSLVTAGSVGIPVVDIGGIKCLLSNSHVLSPYWEGEVKIDDPILQPGPVDGGLSTDVVAFLHSWIPIYNDSNNAVDCALARIIEGMVEYRIEAIPNIYEKVGNPTLGQIVIKAGRTTGLTKGKIVTIGAVIYVRYTDTMIPLFIDQLEIMPLDDKPFLLGGDSGSAVLSEDGREVLGLNFAGNGQTGWANRMDLVQQALGFEIIKKPEPEQPKTIEQQLGQILDRVEAVYSYNAFKQEWLLYTLPERRHLFRSAKWKPLLVMERGNGYWLRVSEGLNFQGQPLAKGWNLVGYLGG